ncbi:cereblon -like protein [Brachionus plicatilis]|uniref:Cereblon-like protein n=1 Tax=Brachionus plicatilis TaxID=10195 RepID=A0A3M7SB12_BRAPC|nr:cereblon -like protein [Brachionus plicatilis]
MILRIILIYFCVIIKIITDNDVDFSLLCKKCGHQLTSVKHLTIKKSPYSLKSWNSSLLHSGFLKIQNDKYSYLNQKGLTMIQLLENPMGHRFEVANFVDANVRMLNETKSLSNTWFPNYKWTICLCPQCLMHIGWYFESIVDYGDYFFSLLVDNLIDDTFSEELVIQPKLKMY